MRSRRQPRPLLLRDENLQPFLYNEKCGVGFQLPSRVDELKVVVPQEPRDDLVDLEQGKVAADADVTTTAELHRDCQL